MHCLLNLENKNELREFVCAFIESKKKEARISEAIRAATDDWSINRLVDSQEVNLQELWLLRDYFNPLFERKCQIFCVFSLVIVRF